MADLSNIPWNEFPENAAPDDLVSPNFLLLELSKSEIAARQGIANGFTSVDALRCAVYLARSVLEPVREHFGRYTPNSVFRSQQLERALKKMPPSWRSNSQHTLGQACDIEVPGTNNMSLACWVRDNLEFDQLILECYWAEEGANSGWVHVSVLPPDSGTSNRKQILSYVKNRQTRRFEYVPGLAETP